MRWTERQRAMLREMGIVLWERDAPAGDSGLETSMPGTTEAPTRAAVAAHPVAAHGTGGPSGAAATTGPDAALAPAAWLVVGDAVDAADPTAADQERLLDNMLAAIGVSRTAPTRERRAAFVGLPEGSAVRAGAAASLDAAIAAVQPGCILALGRAAAQAVLDTDEPLGALRGRRESRSGVPVIVTFAPAFLLRHPVDKAKAWADLCLAVRSVEETA
ncbi:MAG TPA: uracil-DNA glycosylase family protein [Caldimonas sp.]|jgi:DNA polymerase|nr:uracil-DNA glycosylase family protein [Caldimonas sp.]HEX2542856.1 uracil-DNA glycosylase family protein [Caldimonas sp.]